MKNRIAMMTATCFLIGRSKFAPGTVGSGLGLAVFFVLKNTGIPLVVMSVCFSILAIWSSEVVSRELGVKDPSIVIIDEVCGMLVTFILVDLSLAALVIGFVLFRLFDILKPFPVRQLEGLKGGFGIVLDDVMAGIYANVLLRAFIHYAHL